MPAADEPQARRRETASVPHRKAGEPHLKNSPPGPDLVGLGFTLWERTRIARTELTIDMVMLSGLHQEIGGALPSRDEIPERAVPFSKIRDIMAYQAEKTFPGINSERSVAKTGLSTELAKVQYKVFLCEVKPK